MSWQSWIQYWVGWDTSAVTDLRARVASLEASSRNLNLWRQEMSQEMDDLKAAYENLKTGVSALLAKVQTLGTNPDAAAEQALTAEIKQDAAALQAVLNPPATS